MIAEFYEYKALIEKFVNREIDVKTFEETYWNKFQSEEIELGDDLFDILDTLYAEVDMYTDVEEAILESPEWNIDEAQLREYARQALDKLIAYEAQNA